MSDYPLTYKEAFISLIAGFVAVIVACVLFFSGIVFIHEVVMMMTFFVLFIGVHLIIEGLTNLW